MPVTLIVILHQLKIQQISKASILVMQTLQALYTHFYLYSLITSLNQNFTRFFKAFINVDAKTTKQLYERNAKNVVASDCNNNVGQPYTICDLCKMTRVEYESYEMIGKASMLILLIRISY